MTLEDLKTEIIEELTVLLQDSDNFNADLLTVNVTQAMRGVKEHRRYPTNYTDEMICADMYRMQSNICNIALKAYNMSGVEGQESHSENGVTRKFVDEFELYKGIIPLAVII